jgi:hypothetical protein
LKCPLGIRAEITLRDFLPGAALALGGRDDEELPFGFFVHGMIVYRENLFPAGCFRELRLTILVRGDPISNPFLDDHLKLDPFLLP